MKAVEPAQIEWAITWAKQQERRSRCPASRPLARLYGWRAFRPLAVGLALKWEGGMMFSATLRRILETYYGVTVGNYSYGSCLRPGYLPQGTVIGNYCSLADGMLVFRRNHPADRLSTHPFFFNRHCGVVDADTVQEDRANPLTIGHDAWIGARAIILAKCKSIGTGAIVGAGSVVTRDVPEFAIVAGNPARVIATRYPPAIEQAVRASQWWLMSLAEVSKHLPLFLQSLPEAGADLLRQLDPSQSRGRSPMGAVHPPLPAE